MASSIETGPSDSPADFEDRLRQYRPHIQVTNIETPQQRVCISPTSREGFPLTDTSFLGELLYTRGTDMA